MEKLGREGGGGGGGGGGGFLVRVETAEAKSFSIFSSEICDRMEERLSLGGRDTTDADLAGDLAETEAELELEPEMGGGGGLLLDWWSTAALGSGNGRCSP